MAATKYETIVLPNMTLIEKWCRDGATDKKIAENLGIAYSTFREYIKANSALSAALKRGKEVVDTEVENALLKRALGYHYDEVTEEDRGGELVITKIVHKHIVPDTTAQIFWLKNRAPDKWRDKTESKVDVSGMDCTLKIPATIEKASLEELRAMSGVEVPSDNIDAGGGDGES